MAAVTTPLPDGVGANAASTETPASGLGTLSQILLWAAVALALLPYLRIRARGD